VAYDERDLARALSRLRRCDTVLVDTPGRGPRAAEDLARVGRLVAALRPDEVHFVFPAGEASEGSRRLLEETRDWGVTHLLPTKLDENGDEAPVAMATRFGLPMRWAADGQAIPADLRILEIAA
jgi:flagellar biosynthesis protein FlhF